MVVPAHQEHRRVHQHAAGDRDDAERRRPTMPRRSARVLALSIARPAYLLCAAPAQRLRLGTRRC